MNGLLLNFFWVATFSAHLSAPGLQASPVVGQEPIRCAPCSPERLAECPVLDAGCPEVLREPGCGCCLACALKRGDLCGIYTAPCGSGLRCLPRPGEARPLHALTRGQAACTETPDADQRQSDTTPGHPESNNGPTVTNDGSSAVFVTGHAKVISTKESMKAKVNAMRKKLVEQGPCHNELQTALDKITKSQQKLGDKMTRFYLPNCDKRGHYKSKQCESSLDGQRGKCWCVSSWNGKRIPGSNDLPTDAECPEELNH